MVMKYSLLQCRSMRSRYYRFGVEMRDWLAP
jgi:hypothetical protein